MSAPRLRPRPMGGVGASRRARRPAAGESEGGREGEEEGKEERKGGAAASPVAAGRPGSPPGVFGCDPRPPPLPTHLSPFSSPPPFPSPPTLACPRPRPRRAPLSTGPSFSASVSFRPRPLRAPCGRADPSTPRRFFSPRRRSPPAASSRFFASPSPPGGLGRRDLGPLRRVSKTHSESARERGEGVRATPARGELRGGGEGEGWPAERSAPTRREPWARGARPPTQVSRPSAPRIRPRPEGKQLRAACSAERGAPDGARPPARRRAPVRAAPSASASPPGSPRRTETRAGPPAPRRRSPRTQLHARGRGTKGAGRGGTERRRRRGSGGGGGRAQREGWQSDRGVEARGRGGEMRHLQVWGAPGEHRAPGRQTLVPRSLAPRSLVPPTLGSLARYRSASSASRSTSQANAPRAALPAAPAPRLSTGGSLSPAGRPPGTLKGAGRGGTTTL